MNQTITIDISRSNRKRIERKKDWSKQHTEWHQFVIQTKHLHLQQHPAYFTGVAPWGSIVQPDASLKDTNQVRVEPLVEMSRDSVFEDENRKKMWAELG